MAMGYSDNGQSLIILCSRRPFTTSVLEKSVLYSTRVQSELSPLGWELGIGNWEKPCSFSPFALLGLNE